ncbi:MAG: protein kinase [Miltoncostaeaceae bacterium]
MRLIPGEVFGRYRIAAELGRGGQAVVYRATQIDLDRPVALKVFDAGHLTRPGALERFRREAIAAGRLEHPRIVTVHDAGEVDGRAYIAMRLVPGDTLAARIARAGALAPEPAMAVLRDIADAVDFAHEHGTVHRDLTPGNILLDPAGGAVLSDFGLVRMDDMPGLTRRGDWLGTAEYVSPEQVEGEPADAASDRYALAAVAFETLTGRAPFVHREPSAVLLAHVRDEPPRASEAAPALPAAVDAVLARGLAKDPGGRPAGARELVDALGVALEVPVPAGRASATSLVATAAAGAAASAGGGGDPWAHALARFAGHDGAGPAPGTSEAGPAAPSPLPERPTEAFGGRSPRRPIALGRDVAAAIGVAAVLLLGGSLVGGWMWGSASADTSGAQERGYAEGRRVGLDAGFARGRAQGVREGRAAGRRSGLEDGRLQGRRTGLAEGREQGRDEGREEGLAEGRAEGVAEGRSTALGALSPGAWYVVFVGSDADGPQIGNSTQVSPDSGECYTVSGGTVFSGACDGGGD